MLTGRDVAGIGIAFAIAAVATPLVRSCARRFDIHDRPGAHKSHSVAVPYLGGLAVILATVISAAWVGGLGSTWVGGLVIGGVLGALGLVDDLRPLHAAPRLLLQLAAAVTVAAIGLRLTVTGVPVVDGIATVVWVLAITNAVNFVDNMDALAAGIAVPAAAAVAVIALNSGELPVAIVALCLAGSCVGFLLYNRPPASIYLGDAGSQFLGFMLAVLAVEVHPKADLLARASLPILLLALPALDIVVVIGARLRRGIKVTQGGRNHLSHRLVALGFSRPRAVAVLIAVECTVAALGVAGTRGLVPVWSAVVVSASLLAGLGVFAARAQVFVEPVRTLPWRRARVIVLPDHADYPAGHRRIVTIEYDADSARSVDSSRAVRSGAPGP